MLTVEKKIGKEAWLEGFAASTESLYRIGFDYFLVFMNETEEGEWNDKRLLEEREQDLKNRNFAFEQKLIEFYEWLKTYEPKGNVKNLSDNSRKSYLRSVRSFFAYHRLDIKFTRQQKAKIGKRAKPKRKYYDFMLEDIKKMASVSKPKERYVLLVGKSLGLRGIDFVSLKQGTFLAHLNEEVPVSLGEVYTIKEGVNAKPFLDYDAKKTVKEWLTILESKGEYDPDKPMLDVGEHELSEILKRLGKRANIKTGNQKIRFHNLRVFAITRLSKVLETNRWKQIVGKTVPESAYVKPFLLREDYRKVLPLTTVNTTASLPEKEELQKINQRIIDLEKENVKLREGIRTLGEILAESEKGKAVGRRVAEWLAEIVEEQDRRIEELQGR